VFRRVEDARKANPDMKLVVVDPRRTDTAELADLHLALLPGTDIALYNAMLHVMLWEGWADMAYIEAHTEGFQALKKLVRDYTPAMAAGICGEFYLSDSVRLLDDSGCLNFGAAHFSLRDRKRDNAHNPDQNRGAAMKMARAVFDRSHGVRLLSQTDTV
jgi:hypothetical protein